MKHEKRFVSLKEDDATEIGINRAIELIQKNIDEKKEIIIGTHPDSNEHIIQKKGIKEDQIIYPTKKRIFQYQKI